MECQKSQQPMIRVVVRKRPLSKKELARSEQDVVDVPSNREVIIKEQKVKVDLTKYVDQHTFRFDQAVGHETSNSQLYGECVRPLVEYAFKGARVTCFAYGQTGSGKTYTMNGDHQNGVLGMYYLGAEDIFTMRDRFYPSLQIHLSFYQIYCSKLFDLLNGREQLQAREDAKQNVNIIGLTAKKITTPAQFMQSVAHGSAVRITSQNSTNADSSRSHAILQIQLRTGKKTHGKLTFIDLAGCERGADTLQQNKQTKIDGAQINKSLLALKECIRALDQGKTHTPFRGSKLTMVLKDSFCGFCKTVMIANIAPSSGSCENTLNTLRYADRVKTLKKGNQSGKEELGIRNYRSRTVNNQVTEEEKGLGIEQLTKAMNTRENQVKKMKYIVKDENERNKGAITPVRNVIMSGDNNYHQQPLKSVNHIPKKRDVSRNKSIMIKEKPPMKRPEQRQIQKNQSMLLLKNQIIPIPSLAEQNQWDRAVYRFRKWAPTPYNFAEMSQLFEDMVGLMMKEQVQLADVHRGLLVLEEQSQKQLVILYQENQSDSKNNSEMMDWAAKLTNALEKKGQGLSNLKQKSVLYQQHLREHQFCENRLVRAAQMMAEGQHHFSLN